MSPPTLITIPRELRQHVLTYVFSDAILADLNVLRKTLFKFYSEAWNTLRVETLVVGDRDPNGPLAASLAEWLSLLSARGARI